MTEKPTPRRFRLRRIAQALLAALVVVPALVALHPDGRYLLRAAYEEARILWRRRPIAELVADSSVSPAVRARLQFVLDARHFAVTRLGLQAGESFTTYSRLDRDTLVLVLSAAYRDRLEAYRWWFPVVGRLPYKGWFRFDVARQARAEFQRRGFDTYLRPASAFSTLGWFNDPLLSTTLRQDTLDLANTVIHELCHNTLFVKGAADFNESLASFVGARGAAEFFRSRGQDSAARRVDLEWEDDKRLGAFWSALARSVDSAYAAWPGDSAARVRARDTVFARARVVLVDSLGPLLQTVARERLGRVQFDNAALLARRVYARNLDLFEAAFERQGRDVRRSIDAVLGVARGSEEPFEALRQWLGGTSWKPMGSGARLDVRAVGEGS